MSTADIMKCRHCEKYVGNKTNLEDYFFWCNKECHDLYEKSLLAKLDQTAAAHNSAYEGKQHSFGGNGAVVAVEQPTAVTKEKKKTKKNKDIILSEKEEKKKGPTENVKQARKSKSTKPTAAKSTRTTRAKKVKV